MLNTPKKYINFIPSSSMTWICEKRKSPKVGKFVILFFYHLMFINRYKIDSLKQIYRQSTIKAKSAHEPSGLSGRHLEYFYSSLDGMPVHRRIIPELSLPVRPVYTLGWRKALWEVSVLLKNATQCPRPVLEPRKLDPLTIALTMRPAYLNANLQLLSFYCLPQETVVFVSLPRHSVLSFWDHLDILCSSCRHGSLYTSNSSVVYTLDSRKCWHCLRTHTTPDSLGFYNESC